MSQAMLAQTPGFSNMSLCRAVLVSSFVLGWSLAGCGGTGAEVVQPPVLGASETSLVDTHCHAPVVQRLDGSYAKLSDTGLYCSIALNRMDRYVDFYEPEIGLWIDGASKRRYLRLPPGTKIDSKDMDKWIFPVGTKVWKELSFNGAKIETRMFEKRSENGWFMVSFQWDAQQTDAYPVPLGVSNANGTQHDIPSTTQCRACHGKAADKVISVSPLMLERASPWGLSLYDLVARNELTHSPTHVVQFPGNHKTRHALAYLYANCSHCHRSPSAPAGLDLSTSVEDQKPEDTAVYRTAVNGLIWSWLFKGYTVRVAPGSPESSGLLARMSTREPGDMMPELGSEVVDHAGVAMIRDWIMQLP
jgi:hypothetical protein